MQIHAVTAEYLNVNKNKHGFYEDKAERKLTMHQHTTIMMQFQSDIKAQHLKEMQYLQDIINNLNNS